MDCTALDLIDKLIGCWNYFEMHSEWYLKKHAPAIIRGEAKDLTETEQEIITQLQELLSRTEWERLPELISLRHSGQLEELESDRKRRQEQEELLVRKRHEEEERQRQEQEVKEKKSVLLQRIRTAFESDFLSADKHFQTDPDRHLLPDVEYSELKSKFLQEWAKKHLDLDLDLEQATAAATFGGDTLVVARAGSGKTRVLVSRALFLQEHCSVSPNQILLLAFNRDAASEMKRRLEKHLGDNLPYVMTFHALAYALVHPDEELLYDDPASKTLKLSQEIQRIIDEHLKSEQDRTKIRDLMLMHFRDDWERIVSGRFDLPAQEFVKYRESLTRETLNGEYVKSFGEKLIANTLFRYGIEYKYQRSFRWNGVNYKPDFTIFCPGSRGVIIEYFGARDDPDYDKMDDQKRRFWKSMKGWTFLEFSPRDIAGGAEEFSQELIRILTAKGVTGRYRSDEEIWQIIRDRAVDSFTNAMKSFVNRCRKTNLSADELNNLIASHASITESERLFLELASTIYSEYLDRLRLKQKQDFDGLMWEAIKCVEKGQTQFSRNRRRECGDLRALRFVLVDEFQDMTETFYRLLKGISCVNPSVEFFCVGDDWQAINGFAGSDLKFYQNFEEMFRSPSRVVASTNYRSPIQVVNIGNALMRGKGTPAKPNKSETGYVRKGSFSDFTPNAEEQKHHNGDEATPAVLRIVQRLLAAGDNVVLLSRRNGVPWYVDYNSPRAKDLDALEQFAEHVRSFFPKEDRKRISVSTVHKYKGREKDAVILLDAQKGSFPLIHPDWIFLRVFGDDLERIVEEERRLFYVALTRATRALIILSESSERESPFLRDIQAKIDLQPISWSELPPISFKKGPMIEVRISNAYQIRDQLKKVGYRWNDEHKYWYKSFYLGEFDWKAFCGQPWAQTNVDIKILTEEGKVIFSGKGPLKSSDLPPELPTSRQS